jgi:glycosyltransferase 2 family protein
VVTQKYARGHSVEVALSVLANRLVGLFALLPVAFIGLTLNTSMFASLEFIDPITLVVVAGLLSSSAVFGGYALLTKYSALTSASSFYHPTVAKATQDIVDALMLLRSQGRYLWAAFCVALVTHLFNVLSFYCMCRAMPMEPLTIGSLLFIVPIGYLAAILPIAPAGIGVGQVAFGFLTSLVTTSQPDQGANLFTAYQVTMCAVNLSGLYFFLRLRRQERDDLGVDSNIVSKPRIS